MGIAVPQNLHMIINPTRFRYKCSRGSQLYGLGCWLMVGLPETHCSDETLDPLRRNHPTAFSLHGQPSHHGLPSCRPHRRCGTTRGISSPCHRWSPRDAGAGRASKQWTTRQTCIGYLEVSETFYWLPIFDGNKIYKN